MFLLQKLLSVIAPHNCLACGREGQLLCSWCAADAFLPLPERCYRCFKESPYSRVCRGCRYNSKLKHVWIATEYGELSKRLIHKLKFEHAPAAAETIAAAMDRAMPFFAANTVVTYVPTSSVRVRRRGFDHSGLIAKAFAAKRKLPYSPVLARSGQARQVGARREQRASQLQGAFRVINPRLTQNANILLVDDVTTTGSTVEEAARTLRLGGAKSVNAAVFAQKLLN